MIQEPNLSISQRNFSRRSFLRRSATLLAAMGIAGCGRNEPTATPEPPATATATPLPATATPVPKPTPTPEAVAQQDQISLRLLWTGDSHGQLRPVYHREIYDGTFLEQNGLDPESPEAYCCSHENFIELAGRYGKVGGFAHLATLINQERDALPDRTLLLDSGDSWYGSALAYLTDGQANVQVMNAIGYDAMTMHWEFNLGQETLLARIDEANFPVLVQNLVDTDFGDPVMPSTLIKEFGDLTVAVIGEAYPFSLLTTEERDINPGWRMGYRDVELQDEVDRVRDEERADLVILLSHMGYLQDRAMAERLTGIDVIVGGHTHDILWQPEQIGQTLILQAGSHGKFLGELDLTVEDGLVTDYTHRLMPVIAEQIAPDPTVGALIDELYAPYTEMLGEEIGETASLLYRRSLTGGTTDAFMAQAYRAIVGAELGCVPGWRFGTTLLPGVIMAEDIYNGMKPTPSPIYASNLQGRTLRTIIEDNLDNVFNADPLQRLGGDINRCAGMQGELLQSARRGERAFNLTLNAAPLEDDQRYLIANSGGRAYYLDEESEPTAQPAVNELIDYIRAQANPISAEPVQVYTMRENP